MSILYKNDVVVDSTTAHPFHIHEAGKLTAPTLWMSATPLESNPTTIARMAFESEGMFTAEVLTAKFKSRPVYVVLGRDERPALLIGPTGFVGNPVVPTSSNTDNIAPWFKRVLSDGLSTDMMTVAAAVRRAGGVNAESTIGASAKINLSPLTGMFVDSGYDIDNHFSFAATAAQTGDPQFTPGFNKWVSSCLGRGVFVGSTVVQTATTRECGGTVTAGARGKLQAGLVLYMDDYIGHAQTIDNIWAYPYMYGFNGANVRYASPSPSGKYLNSGLMPIATSGWTTLQTRFSLNGDFYTSLHLSAPTKIQLSFPFGIVSDVVGYVTGLPHEHEFFIMEFEPHASTVMGIDSAPIIKPTLIISEVTGASYKSLFRSSVVTVAADKTLLESNLAQMPDDLRVRVSNVVGGIDYGTLRPEETVVALDMVRAGQTLDDLTIATVADSTKFMTYTSMIGGADYAISKKKNSYAVFFRDSAASAGLSSSGVTFDKTTGTIVITDTVSGGVLASQDAFLRIRMGATITYTACTNNEVAQVVFGYPTWSALMEVGGGDNSFYCFDETVLSEGGTFVSWSDDERARVIPFILGVPRDQAAIPIAAQSRGATPSIRVLA